MQKIETILKQKSKIVDGAIFKLVSNLILPNLREPALHLIRAGGKRIRPAIMLLSAEALGSKSDFVLPPAASIELMHTASLVHDDIIDNCTIRRGVESVHVKWGIPTAILAGDAMLAVAVRALALPLVKTNIGGIRLSYLSDDFIENLELFSKFWGIICDGKKMDIITDYRQLNEENALELIYKKTAVLFELAGRLGANYTGAEHEIAISLGKYGKNIGIAFQIQDDILGLVGEESVLGKNVGVDISNGKKTFPLCHFLNTAKESEKKAVLKVLGRNNMPKKKLAKVIEMIEANGSIEYSKKCAAEYTKEAKKYLGVLKQSAAKKTLEELPDFVIKRMR